MKQRFSSIDIVAMINELQKHIGMRVNQIYDVDNKTYLIKLNRYEEKITLLLESGVRIHTTEFDWPKNPSPSGFSMKMRKHLKNKRLEKLSQVGMDRILDLQFGINEAAYHVILELYDRGNIVLTDCEYLILNILRPRTTDSEDVKLIVRETYPIDKLCSVNKSVNRDEIYSALNAAKDGDNLKKVIMPHIACGPALLDHVMIKNDFTKSCCIGKQFNVPADIHRLFLCLEEADKIMTEVGNSSTGFVIHKIEQNKQNLSSKIETNIEFHPYLFCQFESMKYTEYPSFDRAVDSYFSSMEGQKIDLKAFQREKEAFKKLENVKKDHEQRLSKLHESQAEDIKKAQLIEMNLDLVDKAILVIRSAIANQISWSDIQDLIKEAQAEGDPVAKAIKKLKLDINHFSILLGNLHLDSDDETDSKPQVLDIDLDCSAYANARKYYNRKRAHAQKHQKTIESSEKAFKNAEKKTKQALKEVAITTSITKARKILWFEKFLWFISSENFLVIAGRDVQQNEMLVKKYLKPGDLYVHADLHGASSLIIKNPTKEEVPPKTLNEAATMAVCYSSAWDAKVITSAWWVHHHQVSKTAPTGEYLTTGSFMIRGKKNYLSPSHLILGFGFMFKLDEESIEHHFNERNVRKNENVSEIIEDNDDSQSKNDDKEAEISDGKESENGDESENDDKESENDDKESENDDRESENDDREFENDDRESDNGNKESENDDNSENDIKESEDEFDGNSGGFSNEEKVVNILNPDSDQKTEADEFDSANSTTVAFPDTEVKLEVFSESNIEKLKTKQPQKDYQNQVIIQQSRKKNVTVNSSLNSSCSDLAKEKQNALKRGQKGKLKKMKEKYKYQDEEERELKMKILGSAGQPKEEKKSKKNKKGKAFKLLQQHKKVPQRTVHYVEMVDEVPLLDEKSGTEIDKSNSVVIDKTNVVSETPDADDDELDDDLKFTEELKLINSLTGIPLSEDALLFAVPVCAPYTSMLNYKYKVKIIPGSSKRGKAGKTALQIFIQEKSATSREKDLLKSVKDQDISRNLPGKIKISTANYKKAK